MQWNKFSEAAPVLIAGGYLVVIIAVLWVRAREQRVPSEDYIRAVHAAMQPNPRYVSHSLLSVNVDQPVTVVTWLRRDQVPLYKDKTPDKKNTWVTVVPWLKAFCQDYVRSHKADPEQLTLRLKQRLGLPPGFNYDSFVEFKVRAQGHLTVLSPLRRSVSKYYYLRTGFSTKTVGSKG